jgi:hypothetical protein
MFNEVGQSLFSFPFVPCARIDHERTMRHLTCLVGMDHPQSIGQGVGVKFWGHELGLQSISITKMTCPKA